MSRPLGGHRRTCLSKIPIFTLCSTATLFYFFRAEVWTQRGGIQLLAKRKSSFFHLFRQEGGTLDLGAAHRKDKSEKNVETTGQGPSSGKKRERHEASPEKSQKRSPESHRRHRRPGPGLPAEVQGPTIESAKSVPVSHPIEDISHDLSEAPAAPGGPRNGILRGDPFEEFVLRPLHDQASAAGLSQSQHQINAQKTSKRGSSHGQAFLLNIPPGIKGKAEKVGPSKHQVAHSRLSFGEELDEEEADGSNSFSMAQSTAERFQRERELHIPSGNSLASPFSNFEGGPGVANGRSKKSLGQIHFGVAQARGPRPYMEDRYTIINSYIPLSFASKPMPDDVARSFAAVYDGHNGIKAADHACARLHMVLAQEPALRTCTGEVGASALPWASHDGMREAQEAADMGNAVRRAFSLVDGEILERAREEEGRDGATALIVLRIGEVIWAAHAGDSRAVLCRDGKAVRLTQDHKPDLLAEKARVEAAGGKVDFQRCWRVICPARKGRPASGLAVSRSLGDLDFKEPCRFIECEPDVTRLRATDVDSFVIMASDGVWDVLSDQEAVDVVQESLTATTSNGESIAALDARIKEAAEKLASSAASRGSMDNITALLLLLQWH